MAKRCGPGEILRKGYTRKAYTRSDGTRVRAAKVQPKCIKDRGKKGKGPKVIGSLKKGTLTKYGYHLKTTDVSKRHTALRKAVRSYGRNVVVRKLNAVRVLQRNTSPTLSKRAGADMRWVQRQYPLKSGRKTTKASGRCPAGTIRNPKTGRCVKRDGAVGKKILAARKKKR